MPSDFNAPEDHADDHDGLSGESVDIDLSKITVLVVEDEDVISDVICALLQKIGVRRAVAVRNAEDAIFQLEDDETTKIDIALVDLMLPGASGLALIKTIREHSRKRLKDLPIVVVTSYTSMKVYKKAAEFNINGFLRKPVAPGALETAVIKALGGKISTKAMDTYRAEATALHGQSGQAKKPGFFAMLFGTDTAPPKPPAQKPGQRKAAAPKTTAPPGVKINRNA